MDTINRSVGYMDDRFLFDLRGYATCLTAAYPRIKIITVVLLSYYAGKWLSVSIYQLDSLSLIPMGEGTNT